MRDCTKGCNRFMQMPRRIEELETVFQRNADATTAKIWLTFDELHGALENILAKMETRTHGGQAQVKITLGIAMWAALVRVHSSETRRKVVLALANQGN